MWAQITLPTENDIYDIKFITNNIGFAVGENGVILKTSDGGNTWDILNVLNNYILYSLIIIDDKSIFTVGRNSYGAGSGDIVLYSSDVGNNWNEINTSNANGLYSVFGTDINTIWSVGEFGTILKYTDTKPIPNPPSDLTVSSAGTVLNIAWNDNSNDETGFEIFRSDSYSGNYKKIATVNQNTVLYQDNNVNAPVTYWYRARSVNSTGSSALCREDSATTILPLPSVPTLVSPLNNSTNQPISLKLTWNASNGAETYQCQVATDFQFNNIVVDDSTLSSTSKSLYGLTNNILYYWKVRAKNISGNSQWSEIWNFTTVSLPLPTKPALSDPPNGATGQGSYIFMYWEYLSVSSYRLQIAKDINFTSIVLDSAILYNSASIGPLEYSTTYYWHVNATNSSGTGPWSDTWSFSTLDMIPLMPVLNNPPNGSINEPVNTLLRWSKSQYTTRYHLQISTSFSMVPIYFESDQLADTFYQCNLQTNMTYYWRVRSCNASYNSSWTSTWYFTTQAASSVEKLDNTVPGQFSLKQNYPNPFNPTTVIEFDLAEANFTDLSLYDNLGRLVKILFRGEINPGRYRVILNAEDLTSGIYYYRIYSGKNLQIKKILLIK